MVSSCFKIKIKEGRELLAVKLWRQRQAGLLVSSQPGLHSNFQDSLVYINETLKAKGGVAPFVSRKRLRLSSLSLLVKNTLLTCPEASHLRDDTQAFGISHN